MVGTRIETIMVRVSDIAVFPIGEIICDDEALVKYGILIKPDWIPHGDQNTYSEAKLNSDKGTCLRSAAER